MHRPGDALTADAQSACLFDWGMTMATNFDDQKPSEISATPIWLGLPDPPRLAIIDGKAMTNTLLLGLQFGVDPRVILDAIANQRPTLSQANFDAAFECLGECPFDSLDPAKGGFLIFGVTDDGFNRLSHLFKNPDANQLFMAYIDDYAKLAQFLLAERLWLQQQIASRPPSDTTENELAAERLTLMLPRLPARQAFYNSVGLVGLEFFMGARPLNVTGHLQASASVH